MRGPNLREHSRGQRLEPFAASPRGCKGARLVFLAALARGVELMGFIVKASCSFLRFWDLGLILRLWAFRVSGFLGCGLFLKGKNLES